MKPLLISGILFVFIFSQMCSAAVVSDPENVTYMKIDVMQSGHITLRSQSSLATAEQLKLTLYIPQNDGRQMRSLVKVMGPDDYTIEEDEYGNEQMVLIWNNPAIDTPNDYLIETTVDVYQRQSNEVRDFPVTDIISPSEDIIETAYTISSGSLSVLGMLRLSNWVNSNVDYDLSCEKEVFSASWVFDNRIGTCDEFANLLLSMLKTLGYQSWYVAGYAYLGGRQEDGKSFGSHAWVETRLDGKTYSIDPTWAESPVDATHIAFARLPDSGFTEHTEVKSRDIKISWQKDETRLEALDFEQNPRIKTSLDAAPSPVEGGKDVIILADMASDDCVSTQIRIASCINENGDALIDFHDVNMPVAFCGSRKFKWVGETPKIRPGVKYTCPVSVSAGGGITKYPVTITSESLQDTSLSVSSQKILVPGQKAKVSVTATSDAAFPHGIKLYAMLGDEMMEKDISFGRGSSAEAVFTFTAPKTPGEYELLVFAGTGDSYSDTITVISERHLKISEISIPVSLQIGQSSKINVTIVNLGDETEGNVLFSAGDIKETRNFALGSNETATETFTVTGPEEGSIPVTLSVLDKDGIYQDSWVGSIGVRSQPSFKKDISGQVERFIMWLLDIIKSLLGD